MKHNTSPASLATSRKSYYVTCGNIGTVYAGNSRELAEGVFFEYKTHSVNRYGRASGESVCMFEDGDLSMEHNGECPHI